MHYAFRYLLCAVHHISHQIIESFHIQTFSLSEQFFRGQIIGVLLYNNAVSTKALNLHCCIPSVHVVKGCVFPTGKFNKLIDLLQKFLDEISPRLSTSEPVYGDKGTVERLIDSHQVSIMSSDNLLVLLYTGIFCEVLYFTNGKLRI